jgi:hypothetical protein
LAAAVVGINKEIAAYYTSTDGKGRAQTFNVRILTFIISQMAYKNL